MENNPSIIDITEETEEQKKERELKERKEKYIEQLKNRDMLIKKELINLVMRQTTYSEDEAKEQLEKNKYNFHLVLKEFMTPNTTKQDTNNKSINIQQTIYKEIRTMMDSASRKQRYQAEFNRRMEEQKEEEQKKKKEEQKKENEQENISNDN